MEPAAMRGMALFYGDAECFLCHTGPLLTDQDFHAMALPAFGPGRTRAFEPVARDVGRIAVTDDPDDAYRFRTPSLRNVALTGPWGHNGAYGSLRDMIRHMADPATARAGWSPAKLTLPAVPWLAASDFAMLDDRTETARQAARIDVAPRSLTDREVADLEAFLVALTGAKARKRPLGRPETVPSGLPVD
jgi:cytochrome c peroxidase